MDSSGWLRELGRSDRESGFIGHEGVCRGAEKAFVVLLTQKKKTYDNSSL